MFVGISQLSKECCNRKKNPVNISYQIPKQLSQVSYVLHKIHISFNSNKLNDSQARVQFSISCLHVPRTLFNNLIRPTEKEKKGKNCFGSSAKACIFPQRQASFFFFFGECANFGPYLILILFCTENFIS